MSFNDENELETRDNLIRYFTRYLQLELLKVNPAFRFFRIETPVLISGTLRNTTANGAYETSKELLNSKQGPKHRLPIVIWQYGKIFQVVKKQTHEVNVLEYHILFSNTTATKYFPKVVRYGEVMLRKQCGKIIKADEDESVISILTHDTDMELATLREQDFWGGKDIEICFDMDLCTKVNIQHEFGKIRRGAPVDKK